MNLRSLLLSPTLPADLNESDTYLCACIGALTILRENGAWDALREVVLRAPAEEIRSRALRALTDAAAAAPQAAHALNLLAVIDGSPEAAACLKEKDYPDPDPELNCAKLLLTQNKAALRRDDPELFHLTAFFDSAPAAVRRLLVDASERILPHWSHLAAFQNNTGDEERERVTDDYAHYSSAEKALLLHVFPNSAFPAELLLRYDDPLLAEHCLKHDLRPSDPRQHALFYFLSGQWSRYEAADSDYRFIRSAYEQGDASLQRRLLDLSSRSGHTDWLVEVSRPQSGQHSGEMHCSDFSRLIETLIRGNEVKRLWELLPTVPVLCMRPICEYLEKVGFLPNRPDEREFLHTLTDQLRHMPDLIPLPTLQETFHENAAAAGMDINDHHAAVSFLDRSISIRKSGDLKGSPILINSENHLYRTLALDPDGKYLLSDTGDGNIVFFELPSAKSVHTLGTGLFPIAGIFIRSDRRKMMVLDAKGNGKIFSYPGGTPAGAFTLRCGDCFRFAADPRSDLTAGISLKGAVSIFDFNREKEIGLLPLSGPFSAVSERIENSLLSYIDGKNAYHCLHLLSGKHTAKAMSLEESDRVLRMQDLIPNEYTIVGTQKGSVSLYDVQTGRRLAGTAGSMGGAIRALRCSPDKSFLCVAAGNGRFRALDLRLFRALSAVYELQDLPGSGRLTDYEKQFDLPEVHAAAAPLKTVILWRRRFDIEVSYDFE